jgi:hypothetical protein
MNDFIKFLKECWGGIVVITILIFLFGSSIFMIVNDGNKKKERKEKRDIACSDHCTSNDYEQGWYVERENRKVIKCQCFNDGDMSAKYIIDPIKNN